MSKKNVIANFIKKYKNLSVVAKAALWFTFATFLQKGISFITVPIFTRIMTTEQYGLYSAYMSLVNVFTILCGLEFHTCIYINNLAKIEDEKEKDRLAVSLINLSFIITTVWLVIYIAAKEFWNKTFGVPSSMMYLMFLEAYFVPVVNLWSTKQRYNYKYKVLVLWSVLHVVLNATIGIVLVLLSDVEHQAAARVLSIALVQATFGFILVVSYSRKAGMFFNTSWWGKAMKLHLPLLPHSLSLTVLSSADRLMINNMVGATETALYGVAYSASMVINLIKLSVVNALTPWIYECVKNQKFDSLKKRSNMVIILVMMMSFTFILFAPELMLFVGGKEYYSAIYVVPPVAASVFFTFLYNLFSTVEFYYEKTKEIMYASVAAAILNIVLNVICIQKFGYVAAAYTTLICYMMLSFAHYVFMKSAVKANIGDVEVFDMKFICAMACVVLVSSVLFSILYNHTVVRYVLILMLLVTMFIKRKDLVGILKKT